ncbi:MAG: hypothetical protein A2745_00305 [Candidatus Harrisonbacteria bacterium RIFCSPHIGHO2_01_FULL_44_13]|nr:MAG: hypothetical protein A2745_00305 [Candidatus Harrisonbacteria bacterium RIFCSPHIGHO2_01_FULL_44_13]
MKKVKILYLITKDGVGGAQKYVHDLAEKLDKEKFEIEILTGGKEGARYLSNAFRPYFFFINDWLAVVELFSKLRQIKPNILHLNSSKAGIVGSLSAWLYRAIGRIGLIGLIGPIKVIFTAHGWVFNPNNNLSRLRRQFYIWLHKLAAKFQDHIINVSEYDRQLALKHKIAPPEKLVTIHNGIDHQNLKFFDKQTARKTLLKLANLSTYKLINSTWVGSIGRLVKEKNYETFIEAASLLKDKSVKFFIIGSGPEHKKLETGIEKLGLGGRFFIIENLAPAAPYLKAFDIFVLSSIKEGLPYTLLEAMAAELPIITTRVGGMTEIIDKPDNGKNGLAVLPREPEELSRAINYLLENPQIARQLAVQAYKKLKNNLGIEKMAEKTKNIYIC